MSWLKYLDIEYLDETECNAVSVLDINDPNDWTSIIELTMRKNGANFSSASRASMIDVLDNLAGCPELEARQLIERVAMPIDTPLQDYLPFFKHVRRVLFDYASSKTWPIKIPGVRQSALGVPAGRCGRWVFILVNCYAGSKGQNAGIGH